MMNKILIGVDGSPLSLKAVSLASDIASKYGSKIFLIHVITQTEIPEGFMEYARVEKLKDPPGFEVLYEIANRILEQGEDIAREKGIREVDKRIEQGDPATKITQFAKNNGIDLIVLGSRRLGRMKELLLGSVSTKVCHTAQCTCITVK